MTSIPIGSASAHVSPGSSERQQGLYSGGRVKAFSVATVGATNNYSITTAGGVGTFVVGEVVNGAGKSGVVVSTSGGPPTQTLVIAPLVGVFANANAITGASSGATANVGVRTDLGTVSAFNPDRSVFGAGPTIPVTWPTTDWVKISQTTAGWRHERLQFPCTPCITLFAIGPVAGRTIRFRVSGVGQFGEEIVETSPVILLQNDVLLPNGLYHIRFWMSRVFSQVRSVEYQTSGAAMVANIYCGSFFTWDESLTTSVIDVVNSIVGHYYFPYNQGIGTQIKLAGELGPFGARFPEVVSFTLRKPTGGTNGTMQVNGSGDLGANGPGVFVLGTATPAYHYLNGVDAFTGIKIQDWKGDGNKIQLQCLSKLVDYAGAIGRIKWWDDSLDDPYTPANAVIGGRTHIDNPKPLIYDFVFRTRAGARTPKLTQSSHPGS